MIATMIVSLLVLQGGLKTKDVSPGQGAKAKVGDVLTMEYTGVLKNGKKFDSSTGKAPYAFELGAGTVIKGWDQGIAGMRVGGKRKIIVPPELGYGDKDNGDIPAKSTLYFDVKLLRIDPKGETQKISFKDTKKGTGPAVKAGDAIKVHCTGKFINGVKFWSSHDAPAEPLPVTVGAGGVIKGFDQALVGMKKGSKRTVLIPYKLAYGENGRPPTIPKFSTLVFDLEIISID